MVITPNTMAMVTEVTMATVYMVTDMVWAMEQDTVQATG